MSRTRAGYLCGLVTAVGIVAAPSHAAASERHRFDIPAGSASAALRAFAQQSGKQIIFPYDVVSGRSTRGYRGEADDRVLLRQLARNAGLVVVSDDGGVVILGKAPESKKSATAAPSPRADPKRSSRPRRNSLRAAPPRGPGPTELIVTANKRVQVALTVPSSISVIPGSDLRTQGIANAADLQNVVPGVNVNSVQHGIVINIRGVTTTDVTSKGEPGVSFNIDGVFVGRPIEQGLAFYDLERIEVLRGPQGTLYGRSATGGAVNVVTRKPTRRLETYGILETGNYHAARAEGAVNLPVSDWLAVRLAGIASTHDGYLATADGRERKSGITDQGIRLSAVAHAAPDASLRVTLTAGHVGGSGSGYANLGNFIYGRTSREKRTLYPSAFPAGLDHDFLNLDAEVNAAFGSLQFTWLGAHQDFDGNERTANNNDPNDPNPPTTPIDPAIQIYGRFLTHITTDAHEVRLANRADSRFEFVLGGNYYREHIRENDHNWAAPRGDPDPAHSVNYNDIIGTTVHTSLGLFGQATLHAGDRIDAIGGLRFSRDSVRRQATSAFGRYDALGQPCYGPADCIGNPVPGHQRASKATYRIGLNYRPTEQALFYASIATGYKAGGFNDANAASGTPTLYAPEQLTAYELGFKGRPAASLRLESAFFYYDYSKTQIAGVIFLNGSGILNTRVVPTRIYGWETQLSWRADANTTLDISAAFEHSSYVRFLAGFFQDMDWSGLPLDRTPGFVGTATLNQSWALPEGWNLRARAFSKVSSAYYVSDFTSGLRFRQKPFTRSDASLTLAAPADRWYLQVYIQNIENHLQATSPPQNYDPTYLNASYLNITDPRSFGLRFGFNWR